MLVFALLALAHVFNVSFDWPKLANRAALRAAVWHVVIASGVESYEEMINLQAMGCTMAQGYFISRPMPAVEVEGWLSDWSSSSARLQAA